MVNREEKYKDAGILVQIVITVALIMFVLLYLISNISSQKVIVLTMTVFSFSCYFHGLSLSLLHTFTPVHNSDNN